MISVAAAEDLIRTLTPAWGTTTVPLAAAVGRVLHSPVMADRDQPPFARVTMDGIVVSAAAVSAGHRRFRVAGTVRAGEPAAPLSDPASCLEVMTGAVLPPGAAAVVQVEQVTRAGDWVELQPGVAVALRQNIHAQGSDCAAGTPLLAVGTRLTPVHTAILATVGQATVTVNRLPRVAIAATGDELVPVTASPLPHQIRMTNNFALAALLAPLGLTATLTPILPDRADALRTALAELLRTQDVLLLTGGISAGKFDLVPAVLAELGVTLHCRAVSQRPGKPFCFGTHPGGAVVFALPGNPVSALTCGRRYVVPQLWRSAGAPAPLPRAVLTREVTFAKRLTYFLPVTVATADDGRLLATPLPPNGSGDVCGLGGSDGFVELPAEPTVFPAGTVAPLYRWAD